MLKVDKLSVSFAIGGQYYRALNKLNFTLAKGETLALLGESGCGKSLTALALLQLLPPQARFHRDSKILLDGVDLLQLPESQMRPIRGKKIAIIFQEPMTSLNPVLSVFTQLAEAVLRTESISKPALIKRVAELLTMVELPDAKRRMHDYPHQLSGGQKQRVMIAMAMAMRPSLLIADEPTTALDVTIQAQILELLKKLQAEQGMSLLLITHDLGVVRHMASRVAVMYGGDIIETAASEDFFTDLQHPYSQQLLNAMPSIEKRHSRLKAIDGLVPGLTERDVGCSFVNRCQYAFADCQQKPALTETTLGHATRCHYVASGNKSTAFVDSLNSPLRREPGKTLLEVTDANVHFPIHKGVFKRQVGSVKAVDGISFRIAEGETVALVGESGCGKTSLSRALMGLLPLSGGAIRFAGNELIQTNTASLKLLRQGMQIIFQDPFSSMNPRLLVEDIILEGVIAQKLEPSAAARHQLSLKLLEQVGLPSHSLHRYPHQFSGGQRQRIAIARALAMSPRLLICDEPTSALDVSVQAQILNLLRDLQIELGLSYLFISHDIAVVSYLADRVMVMKNGRLVEQGEAERVLNTPQADYTKTLLDAVV